MATTRTALMGGDKEGCGHYRRGCVVRAECCKQWVGCRLCHDEQSDHPIDRHAIKQMQCLQCTKQQPCAAVCAGCEARMGEYFCPVCNLFDHDGPSKQIFHCSQCGICRVGGRENFFHCSTCAGCYPISIQESHKCLENSMRRECAVCLESTFAAREPAHVLPCGHVLHQECWKDVRHGFFSCPTCRQDLSCQASEGENSEQSQHSDDVEGDSSSLDSVGYELVDTSDEDSAEPDDEDEEQSDPDQLETQSSTVNR